MNLKVYLGKDINNIDVVLDFSTLELNLTLRLGATGTGKRVFHNQFYKELIKQNSPESLGFYFIDNTRVDLGSIPKPYLIKGSIDSKEAIKDFDEILEEVKGRNSGTRNKDKILFVHIEECDQFAIDPIATANFYKEFIKYEQGSNIFLGYSTSRIGADTLPEWLVKGANLKVVFELASADNCQWVLGSGSYALLPLEFKQAGQRLLIMKNRALFCQPFSDKELKEIRTFEQGKL